jgi:signal transduction histidine kinase
MSSRLPIWITALASLFVLQVFWWGVLIWRAADRAYDAEFQILNERLGRAQITLQNRTDPGVDPRELWLPLADGFQDIVYVPGVEQGADELQISNEALERVESTRSRLHIMVLSEASLFGVLTILGVGLLLRTARREAFLALQQSNFLHAVTHEFRSPLQSLRLMLETLMRRPDPERARRYGNDMLEDVTRLESLVGNVLAVGRLEAEAFRAIIQVTDLSAAIERVIERFRRSRPTETARIEVHIEPDVMAQADPTTLEPVVRNLLDNALKYGEGKAIRLRLFLDSPNAVLQIQDDGRGIRADEIPRLFDRFWRAGDDRVRTAPGAGLGLFLVRELLNAQGAKISAHSDGLNRGSTFEVHWPMSSG